MSARMQRAEGWLVRHAAPALRTALALLSLLALGGALVTLLSSCGGAPEALRRGTTAAAIGVAAMDAPLAAGYSDAHRRALAASATWAEYDAAISPWPDVERSARATASGLLALDAALDAWDAAASERVVALAACVLSSLSELARLADAVGLAVPAEIREAIGLLGAIASGSCDGR